MRYQYVSDDFPTSRTLIKALVAHHHRLKRETDTFAESNSAVEPTKSENITVT